MELEYMMGRVCQIFKATVVRTEQLEDGTIRSVIRGSSEELVSLRFDQFGETGVVLHTFHIPENASRMARAAAERFSGYVDQLNSKSPEGVIYYPRCDGTAIIPEQFSSLISLIIETVSSFV